MPDFSTHITEPIELTYCRLRDGNLQGALQATGALT